MQKRGNYMKRYCIGVILLVVAVLTIAGCTGRKQQEQKKPLYKDDFQEDNEGYITVGFSQVGSESDWRVANTQSIKSVFTPDNGYYLLYEDAQNKQENQLDNSHTEINQIENTRCRTYLWHQLTHRWPRTLRSHQVHM